MQQDFIKADSYKEAKNIYRVLDNKVRLAILKILTSSDTCTVGDIASELKLFHSVASMHLRLLKKYNVVKTSVGRDTRQRIYSINKDKLIGYNELAENICDYAMS